MGADIFWGLEDQEHLTCTDPDDVIRYLVEDIPRGENLADYAGVTVYEYKPVTVDRRLIEAHFHEVLTTLDENYGPDISSNDPYEPSDAVKDAYRAFVDALLKDYTPWRCEKTGKSETYNLLDWIRENEPEWLEERL